jgi:hypothetical protein
MNLNKVYAVMLIDLVAKRLGYDVDFIWEISNEMETEDGIIWVHGLEDDGVKGFTPYGVEKLIELIEMHKDNP